MNSEKRTLLGGTSQGGRRRQFASIVINQDNLEKINGKILEETLQREKLDTKHEKLVQEIDEANEEYDKWTNEFRFETIEDLSIHTRSIGQPTVEYYNENFNDESGDCYNIRKMANATKIFNPLFLKGQSYTHWLMN